MLLRALPSILWHISKSILFMFLQNFQYSLSKIDDIQKSKRKIKINYFVVMPKYLLEKNLSYIYIILSFRIFDEILSAVFAKILKGVQNILDLEIYSINL